MSQRSVYKLCMNTLVRTPLVVLFFLGVVYLAFPSLVPPFESTEPQGNVQLPLALWSLFGIGAFMTMMGSMSLTSPSPFRWIFGAAVVLFILAGAVTVISSLGSTELMRTKQLSACFALIGGALPFTISFRDSFKKGESWLEVFFPAHCFFGLLLGNAVLLTVINGSYVTTIIFASVLWFCFALGHGLKARFHSRDTSYNY